MIWLGKKHQIVYSCTPRFQLNHTLLKKYQCFYRNVETRYFRNVNCKRIFFLIHQDSSKIIHNYRNIYVFTRILKYKYLRNLNCFIIDQDSSKIMHNYEIFTFIPEIQRTFFSKLWNIDNKKFFKKSLVHKNAISKRFQPQYDNQGALPGLSRVEFSCISIEKKGMKERNGREREQPIL